MNYGKVKNNNTLRIAFFAVVIIIALVYSFIEKSQKQNNPDWADNCDVIVHYIDVGQGDSIFVKLPDGKSMLIDAGENDQGGKVIDYIKSTGEDYLDYVVATHPHSDHIGGMDDVINSVDIGTFYMPDCTTSTVTYESMIDALENNNVKVKQAKSGVVICDYADVKIEILSPTEDSYDDLNNYSAVVKLTYKNKSFLFMGDAETYVEKLITSDVSADVIKLGHHGSSTSSGAKFLNRVNPDMAVISCGKDNEYGHPHKEIIKRLEKLEITAFRTDEKGSIIIGTDGEKIYY